MIARTATQGLSEQCTNEAAFAQQSLNFTQTHLYIEVKLECAVLTEYVITKPQFSHQVYVLSVLIVKSIF